MIIYVNLEVFSMSLKYIDSSDASFDIHCLLEHDVTRLEINVAHIVLQVSEINNPLVQYHR